jgi:hypothetical protein
MRRLINCNSPTRQNNEIQNTVYFQYTKPIINRIKDFQIIIIIIITIYFFYDP